MTRAKLFIKWLEEQGVNKKDIDIDLSFVGCQGFICPKTLKFDADCQNCKYYDFWTKEIN